ncbi:TPA: fibrinogen-binding protein [Staphylococcus aureus]|uniref:fibrinogen-binding protein n=1 Tax=Staphylococcus aureus TaxID=1280 RepID=UPI0013A6B13C|nr:fibrinogen-binding protein [Staphylococcus aureus]MCR0718338.1 fibrinogen-binding protein [Staphylococcus aureus]MDN8770430.1 fibrinogen-binding protein [Staphylococcus aureus]MDN8789456.1 fibrinogen-binding protein [Staphylococcus aureus]NDQ62729.1 fibrinogen-binding protein [Staphylococcus aureus]HCY9591821.1 fibrinogen-binding protein [Staphylococcus aureus]
MKNKLIAKSLLTIASIGITTTTLASTADASEGYGPREKKPISINNNIVEYNDGTFEYGARPQFNKPAAKTEATIKKEQKLIQAQNLVREFEKTHTVSAHRKAQKAVNLVSFEYNVKKMILQERIDQVLKQGLVR